MRNNIFLFINTITFLLSCPLLAQVENTISRNVEIDQNIPDHELKEAINTEFIIHQGIPDHLIDIKAKGGVVTLEGAVDNTISSSLAEFIALQVRGVEAVINSIEVEPMPVDDEEIAYRVRELLLIDPAAEAYEVDVSVVNGVVQLSGEVDSYQEKKIADRITSSVAGVKKVNNQLNYDFEAVRPAEEIKKDVEDALEWDTMIDDEKIQVTVTRGVVDLNGEVASAYEKELAKTQAWVSGVNQVDAEDLSVAKVKRNTTFIGDKYRTRSDEEIRVAIRQKFLNNARLNAFNPEIAVTEGRVKLKGAVKSLKAKLKAEQIVRNTVGVEYFKNFLKVRLNGQPTDDKIGQNVMKAILWDPVLERHELNASVYNGKVYLKGTVDNNYEKSHAIEVVARIKGVQDVENNLMIDGRVPDYKQTNLDLSSSTVEEVNGKTDVELMKEVNNQLWWSPFVNEDDVVVSVEQGVVRLKGEVDTRREKSAAIDNAIDAGAVDVIDEIVVLK